MVLRGRPDEQVDHRDIGPMTAAFAPQASGFEGNLRGHVQDFELAGELEGLAQPAAPMTEGADEEFGQGRCGHRHALSDALQFLEASLRPSVSVGQVDAERRVQTPQGQPQLRRIRSERRSSAARESR